MICLHCNNEFEPNRKGSGGTNRTFCFECMPEGLTPLERKSLRHQLLRNVWQTNKLQRGCDRCGYNKNAAALEWHHPDGDKQFNPSNIAVGFERISKEIDKCALLCANCHREEHFPIKSYYTDQI